MVSIVTESLKDGGLRVLGSDYKITPVGGIVLVTVGADRRSEVGRPVDKPGIPRYVLCSIVRSTVVLWISVVQPQSLLSYLLGA